MKTVADKLREVQGQLPPVEVAGKQYVFIKLRRRDCQETLFNLVQPTIDAISTIIGSVNLKLSDLTNEEKVTEAVMKDISIVSKVFSVVSYDQLNNLAKKLLKNVIINNSIAPDDFENPDSDEPGYYDDKQLELIQALIKAIRVNYPFLGNLMKKKENTKEDSNQPQEKKTG